jgi:desulfoferrodoxin (superoxide reductase-like protein)
MTSAKRTILLFLVVCSFQSFSFGWGCSGHEIVALIAERQLNANAAQQVQSLLQNSTLYQSGKPRRFCGATELGLMAYYATWADDFRGIQPDTGDWHFWDVPLNSNSTPVITDFCDKGCVVKALQDQIAILKSNAPKPQKAKALAFVIHFMGDLHQPLHIVSNNDRGGNCVPAAFFGKSATISADGKATPNLHGLWDTEIPEKLGRIRKQTRDGDLSDFADTLMGEFEDQVPDWQNEDVDFLAWAMESHEHAVKVSYGKLPHHVTPEDPVNVTTCRDDNNVVQRMADLHESVSKKYMNSAGPVVEEQLAKAGTRLAMVLNSIWK